MGHKSRRVTVGRVKKALRNAVCAHRHHDPSNGSVWCAPACNNGGTRGGQKAQRCGTAPSEYSRRIAASHVSHLHRTGTATSSRGSRSGSCGGGSHKSPNTSSSRSVTWYHHSTAQHSTATTTRPHADGTDSTRDSTNRGTTPHFPGNTQRRTLRRATTYILKVVAIHGKHVAVFSIVLVIALNIQFFALVSC